MAKAEAIGLPQYQSREMRLAEKISMEVLEEKRRDLELVCADWEKTIASAMERTYRFALLSRSQLLYVIDSIRQLDPDFKNLYPYVRICFPEVREEGGFRDVSQTCEEFFLAACADADSDDMKINAFLHLIEEFESKLNIQNEIKLNSSSKTLPVVIRCLNKTEEELMRIVEASLKCIPVSSQILWGESSVTRIDIERFLFAAKYLTHIEFAIIGVNELNVDCREYLLNELGRVIYENEAEDAFHGRLSLFFTTKVGIDAFQIFDESSIDPDMHGLGYENFVELGFEKRFLPLEVVQGGPGSGKTVFIKNIFRAANVNHVATLTVHEDFTPSKFIEWYLANAKKSESIGIHLNITPYGNMASLSRFLYNLTAFGLMEDEKTGRIITLLTETKHKLIVELPALKDTPFASKADIYRHSYISKISILHLLAKEEAWSLVNTTTFNVLIDDDYRTVAYYFRKYVGGEFAQPFEIGHLPSGEPSINPLFDLPEIVSVDHIPDGICVDLIAKLFNEFAFSVSKTHMKRGVFIRLLADRFRFIPVMFKQLKKEFIFRSPTPFFEIVSYLKLLTHKRP